MPANVSAASVQSLFQPKSIAVVGASPSPGWNRTLENFASLGYEGDVVGVNPKYEDVLGYKCYPSLAEIPFTPEAVVVGVNRARVVSVIEEAAGLGVKAAVVFAIGFAETGEEGRENQRRIREAAKAVDMAVLGPNCQGLINFVTPAPLYMDIVHPYKHGHVGLISQSGSVVTALTNNKRGVRWSHIVSCGNESVVSAAELLRYYVDDPETRIVVAFLEAIREPDLFFAECDRAFAAGKPVIVLKSGRTEQGRQAAVAHSGALAVSDRLVDELFARHRVLRVDSMDELLNTAVLFNAGRLPSAAGVAAVTGSGGEIELILDEAVRRGVSLPKFGPETSARLRAILPDFLDVKNPLDSWGLDDFVADFPKLNVAMLDDPGIGTLITTSGYSAYPTGSDSALGFMNDAMHELAASTDKAVLLFSPIDGGAATEAVDGMAEHGIAVLSGFPETFRALERRNTFQQPARTAATRPSVETAEVATALRGAKRPIAGQQALDLLASLGIPTVRSTEVAGAPAAVEAARALGYPVALKTGDPDVVHKTDSGAVHLGLATDEAVSKAADIVLRGSSNGSERLLVQAQELPGVEVILGLKTEGRLGTFVIAGLGGIWTELLEDVSIRPAGLREGEAEEMLRSLRGFRLLDGFRGATPVNLAAIADAILRLDALALALGPEIESIDVNPLVARPEGVVALDALIVPATTG